MPALFWTATAISNPLIQLAISGATNVDPAPARPAAELPNLAITPVFRSDGSGDTYTFTNYLSKISPGLAQRRLRRDPSGAPLIKKLRSRALAPRETTV